MAIDELIILLPCHSLEDFPLYHTGEEAAGLLSAWAALWHPALLHAAGRLPSWYRADGTPEDLSNRVIVIPSVSESLIPAGWAARAKNEGAKVIRKKHQRDAILEQALEGVETAAACDPDLVADFLALGYGQLQLELLIRQLRQYTNLDEVHLETQVVAAATAVVEGNPDVAREHLQQCFDVLCESRERCYPGEAFLLDLTLVADTTLGAALAGELDAQAPVNLLIAGQLLSQLAEQQPETFARLKQGYAEKKLDIVGGERLERDLPMFSLESILWGLRAGRNYCQELLGTAPTVFGRRRFGLTPVLPQLLSRLGYDGALHVTLDDGQFPRLEQSRVRWEGPDHSVLDAYGRVPLDANDPTTFLNLPEKIGEAMDLDHVASVALAHWPGQTQPWYEDLRRIHSYAPVLGRFVTFREFFAESDTPGSVTRFEFDEYRSPYFKQAVIRRRDNVISTYQQHTLRRIRFEAIRALGTVVATLKATPWSAELREKLTAIENDLEQGASPLDEPPPADLDDRTQSLLAEQARALVAAMPRESSAAEPGYLVFNPLSFTRQVNVEVPELTGLPDHGGPVLAAQELSGRKTARVEVPALGYAWIKPGSGTPPPPRRRREPPLVEDSVLRNEYMEVTVDPDTGSIYGIRDYRTRGSRVAQQVAFRLPSPRPKPGEVWRDPDLDANYSRMVAEKLEATATGPGCGEITARGKLIDPDGKKLADVQQITRLWRGSRVVEVEITLKPEVQPKSDPWNSYYAARFAWNDAGADLWRSTAVGVEPTVAKRLESPHFVEVRAENTRTLFLTGGLPLHRRVGMRMLDTLLICKGEQATTFRLGIGIDLKYPMQEALSFITPAPAISDPGPIAKPASSWFYHIDARNVVATSWSPVEADGKCTGYRVRLLETEGRRVQARLQSFRAAASARHVDFLDKTLAELTVDDGVVQIDFEPHEWVEVEVLF